MAEIPLLKTVIKTAAALVLTTLLVVPASALESKLEKADGLSRIQLVTAVNEVVPGQPFYVGLLLDHEPGFHTYWRGPGIVGVATMLDWSLPKGFQADKILWPPPQETDMVGIMANGYETDTCLLTRIEVPKTIEGDTVTLSADCAWMACAKSCHPGTRSFSLTLPVNRSAERPAADAEWQERFQEVLASIPPPAPDDWKYRVSLKNEVISLEVSVPGFRPDGNDAEIHFYCDDMQVDSDEPQTTQPTGDGSGFVQKMIRPTDIAPKSPKALSGLLYSSTGWPGADSKWIEVSVPWPKGTFPDE